MNPNPVAQLGDITPPLRTTLYPKPYTLTLNPSINPNPAAQLGDIDAIITDYAGQPTTVKLFLKSYFGYSYSFRWECIMIVAAFIAVFRVGSVLATKFVNFQKR